MRTYAYNFLIMFTQVLLLINFVSAQNKQGVYKTELDFAQKNLTPVGGTNKIKAKNVFSKTITVSSMGVKYYFNKDSVFGYKNRIASYRCNHIDKQDYEIIENEEIVIYVLFEPEYGYKNIVQKPQYYFSKSLNSSIIPLSVINIKKTFPDDFTLHHYLDLAFSQKEISTYNETYKMYQINYLINQLNKQSEK